MNKTAIIRIKGMVGVKGEIEDTLDRLRLRRKYACVVLELTPETQGMLKKVKDFVAYGEINDSTYKELVSKRGQKNSEGKLKPFFRLHPPRGGIDSKKHFGVAKGVLGDNKDKINDLIIRML